MTNDLEQLRSELNLLALAENAGANLRPSHGEWRGCCPIHKGDNKTGFVIYEKAGRQHWRCYTNDCNERGQGSDEFAFLVALTGLPFAQVVKDMRDKKAPIPNQAPPTPEELARRLDKVERELAEQKKRLDEIDKWRERKPWEQYQENAPGWATERWEAEGIAQSWHSFWRLGATDNFTYTASDGNRYQTPTLTIPVIAPHYTEVATVRHKLLQPHDAGDKYRPDMVGLGSHPFIADPDLGFQANRTVIVEGEKKAMVVFQTLDMVGVQVIGIPGKGIWREVAAKLQGQNPVIVLDPDARAQAAQMAIDVGGAKVVDFGRKIDDTITENGLNREWLIGLFKTAQFIK